MTTPEPAPRSPEAPPPHAFTLAPHRAEARPSGALWLPALGLMAVADLHLGKAERLARRGGPLLPPYEGEETLGRLEAEIAALRPETVLCLGDSFDDRRAASALPSPLKARLAGLMVGRRWIWIAGNHDPAPPDLGGEAMTAHACAGLVFRHIAADRPGADAVEISGHYHPKATRVLRGRKLSRRCFLTTARRAILPAFGAFVGGLDVCDAAFDPLAGPDAIARLLPGRPDGPVHAATRATLLKERAASRD